MSVRKAFQAGSLRHRVDIQVPTRGEDSAGGPLVDQWTTLYSDVPASIVSASAREYYAARQVLSDANIQIVIRYRAGVDTSVRLVKWINPDECESSPPECVIYNVEGVLPDETGNSLLTLMCKIRNDNEGFRKDG